MEVREGASEGGKKFFVSDSALRVLCISEAPTTASWTTPLSTSGPRYPSCRALTTPWTSSVASTSAWATKRARQ